MALPKAYLIFVPLCAFAAPLQEDLQLKTLFLMQQGQIEQSIDQYRLMTDKAGRQDFDTLQRMGLTLLQKGIQSEEHQVFLMSLFGAGLSGSTGALDILERGIFHPDPQTQLLALHFISKIDDDRTDELLNRAMSSDYLSTRMEAAFYLSLRKHPHAVGQIEGLMFRLPPIFKPFFPSLFALIGTNDATQALRRLIEDPDVNVRVESILQVAHLGRDDFLPLLRKKLTHANVAELEATIYAIGALKDTASIQKLKRHLTSPIETIRLAAALAFLQLGDRNYVSSVEELAKKNHLFAISALGTISDTEETLATLLASSDFHVRINAAIALLQRHDPRCLPVLTEVLIEDNRDIAFQPFPSIGRTLLAFKGIPSAELRAKDPTIDLTYSLAIREHLLRESIHLPEEDFLALAHLLFKRQQNDLIPCLISLLENLQTDGAKQLLKIGAEKMSAPLIRDYCYLALYRLKVEGPYEEYINRWVMQQKGAELIRLRPILPWKFRLHETEYTLSPEETSKLLIDAFLSIASRREEKNIVFLLDAIQHGNPINRYALMGLLMRATE
ncbi:MAG: HEAT repeat domain-containing protein [Verrucomicrobiota bacterium]|nr:HEAT repeat domain-containing protein [Verrucomicrobiota bacterium]